MGLYPLARLGDGPPQVGRITFPDDTRPDGGTGREHPDGLHAARVGFEPTEGFPSAAFKAAALVHYATSPESPDSLMHPARVPARRPVGPDG